MLMITNHNICIAVIKVSYKERSSTEPLESFLFYSQKVLTGNTYYNWRWISIRDPAIPFLDMYPTEMSTCTHQKKSKRMSLAAASVVFLYWFPIALITNCHELSVLKQRTFILLWFLRSKAKMGLTDLNARCWQAASFWKLQRNPYPCPFQLP